MLHILLVILKIIGIVLAVLLGLVLLILLAVLFAPITYRIDAKKQEKEIRAEVGVYWLFHLIGGRFRYESGKGNDFQVYIFGISVNKAKAWMQKHRKSKKKEEPVQEEISVREDLNDAQNTQPEESGIDDVSQPPDGKVTESESDKKPRRGLWGKIQALFEKVCAAIRFVLGIPGKIWNGCKKIHFTIQGICDKIKRAVEFWKSPEFQEAKSVTWKKLWALLKHLRPRRIRGNLMFGFEDPSSTGQALAGIGMLYPVLPKKLQILPVFDRAVLEGEIRMGGHLVIVVPAVLALQVYFNKSVQIVIKKFKKVKK